MLYVLFAKTIKKLKRVIDKNLYEPMLIVYLGR